MPAIIVLPGYCEKCGGCSVYNGKNLVCEDCGNTTFKKVK